ncbi:hypothetical protein ES705_27040 [subsurface metagenome]
MQKARARVDFHVKINKETRDNFKQTVKEKGFSTCFIIETLINAYLAAAPRTKKAHPSSTITITQNIEYLVKRPRRAKGGVPIENCYVAKHGVWTFRQPKSYEKLTILGHVGECECSACRPPYK